MSVASAICDAETENAYETHGEGPGRASERRGAKERKVTFRRGIERGKRTSVVGVGQEGGQGKSSSVS